MTTEFSHLAIAVQDIDRVKSLFELISGNSITEKKSIQNQKIKLKKFTRLGYYMK